MQPITWAVLAENGNIRLWSEENEAVKKLAERDGLVVTPLYAMPHWNNMDTAPRDRRILVKSQAGELYIAHWVQNPDTGDEAYCVSEGPDGMQHLLHPVQWCEIFVQ